MIPSLMNNRCLIGAFNPKYLGKLIIQARLPTVVPLQLRGTSNQTANLLEVYNLTGVLRAKITAAGEFSNPVNGGEAFGVGSTATASNGVAIGVSCSAGSQGIAIGNSSSAGTSSVILGAGIVGAAQSLSIGSNAQNAANVAVIGSSNTVLSDVYFGKGITNASPTLVTIHGTGGSGADVAGGILALAGGLGTGTGAAGKVKLQVSTVLGSGSTLQTLSTVLEITDVSTVTLSDAVNCAMGSTTGTKWGTATSQKQSFWNATPIIQPTSANQAALTDSTTGTPGFILNDVGVVFSQAAINSNFASLARQCNEFRNVLVNTGLMKGAA